MKNTDINFSNLNGFISSDDSLQTLKALMEDLGLEVEEVVTL